MPAVRCRRLGRPVSSGMLARPEQQFAGGIADALRGYRRPPAPLPPPWRGWRARYRRPAAPRSAAPRRPFGLHVDVAHPRGGALQRGQGQQPARGTAVDRGIGELRRHHHVAGAADRARQLVVVFLRGGIGEEDVERDHFGCAAASASMVRAITCRDHGKRPKRAMLSSSMATMAISSGTGSGPRARTSQSRV